MVEWSILALVVLGFVWAFGQYAKRVHSQAERAAVLTTLGAVRTAMVLHQLQGQVDARKNVPAVDAANPFDLLAQRPPGYGGEVVGRDVAAITPGQWVFDAQCACIGYKPLYADGLESRDALEALWFQRRGKGFALHLAPLDRYVWQGQVVE